MLPNMQPHTKMWLILGVFMAWMALAATLDASYNRRFLACDIAYQRTLNQDRFDACLVDAGVNIHGAPENRLARLVMLR
jgi:hypothetical protein